MSISWNRWLSQQLDRPDGRPRLAIVGVGSELRGDDAAGVMAARGLQTALAGRKDVLVLEAGLAPENCTGVLRRFAPELVLLVDAAQMHAEPGVIHVLTTEQIGGLSASTHTLPLSMLAFYLNAELGSPVYLLGVQPGDLSFAADMTPEVQLAVNTLVQTLVDLLTL